ncbi:unnamed protein product [Amoebophrya sp. A25]|nr:unnamed protein product [Amoebophrya sp. A25]|eukprot:GSA25T00015149001.1
MSGYNGSQQQPPTPPTIPPVRQQEGSTSSSSTTLLPHSNTKTRQQRQQSAGYMYKTGSPADSNATTTASGRAKVGTPSSSGRSGLSLDCSMSSPSGAQASPKGRLICSPNYKSTTRVTTDFPQLLASGSVVNHIGTTSKVSKAGCHFVSTVTTEGHIRGTHMTSKHSSCGRDGTTTDGEEGTKSRGLTCGNARAPVVRHYCSGGSTKDGHGVVTVLSLDEALFLPASDKVVDMAGVTRSWTPPPPATESSPTSPAESHRQKNQSGPPAEGTPQTRTSPQRTEYAGVATNGSATPSESFYSAKEESQGPPEAASVVSAITKLKASRFSRYAPSTNGTTDPNFRGIVPRGGTSSRKGRRARGGTSHQIQIQKSASPTGGAGLSPTSKSSPSSSAFVRAGEVHSSSRSAEGAGDGTTLAATTASSSSSGPRRVHSRGCRGVQHSFTRQLFQKLPRIRQDLFLLAKKGGNISNTTRGTRREEDARRSSGSSFEEQSESCNNDLVSFLDEFLLRRARLVVARMLQSLQQQSFLSSEQRSSPIASVLSHVAKKWVGVDSSGRSSSGVGSSSEEPTSASSCATSWSNNTCSNASATSSNGDGNGEQKYDTTTSAALASCNNRQSCPIEDEAPDSCNAEASAGEKAEQITERVIDTTTGESLLSSLVDHVVQHWLSPSFVADLIDGGDVSASTCLDFFLDGSLLEAMADYVRSSLLRPLDAAIVDACRARETIFELGQILPSDSVCGSLATEFLKVLLLDKGKASTRSAASGVGQNASSCTTIKGTPTEKRLEVDMENRGKQIEAHAEEAAADQKRGKKKRMKKTPTEAGDSERVSPVPRDVSCSITPKPSISNAHCESVASGAREKACLGLISGATTSSSSPSSPSSSSHSSQETDEAKELLSENEKSLQLETLVKLVRHLQDALAHVGRASREAYARAGATANCVTRMLRYFSFFALNTESFDCHAYTCSSEEGFQASDFQIIFVDTYARLLHLLEKIPACRTVGVDFEGVKLCRHGELCLMQLVLDIEPQTIFVIDIHRLGSSAFCLTAAGTLELGTSSTTLKVKGASPSEKTTDASPPLIVSAEIPDPEQEDQHLAPGFNEEQGQPVDLKKSRKSTLSTTTPTKSSGLSLKSLLESEVVTKSWFDCRNDCDALWWQFHISPKHVFDIQVADVLLRKNRGFSVKYVVGLMKALDNIKDLLRPEELRFAQEIAVKGKQLFDPSQGGDYAVFAQRPLASRLLIYSAHDCRHLLRLHENLTEKLSMYDASGVHREAVLRESQQRVNQARELVYVPPDPRARKT